MSWFLLNRNLTLLEPYDWKLSCTVLRGERGSNAPDLPGKAIAKEGMANYIRYLFKTVRKFYGEAVVVTQEVDDIISSPVVKETIINNSDCKILLDQRKYQNKFEPDTEPARPDGQGTQPDTFYQSCQCSEPPL